MDETLKDLWSNLSPEAQAYVGKVLQREKEKLHMHNPMGIRRELNEALKEIVK